MTAPALAALLLASAGALAQTPTCSMAPCDCRAFGGPSFDLDERFCRPGVCEDLCRSYRKGGGAAPPASRPSRPASPTSDAALGVEALKQINQGFDNMMRQAPQAIRAKAAERAAQSRALDQTQRQQAGETERFLQGLDAQAREKEAQRRRGLADELVLPSARPGGGTGTPRLLRGDPAAACLGKPPSLACPERLDSVVPPLGEGAAAAAANGRRLQAELDAAHPAEDDGRLQAKLSGYYAGEAARVGWDKAKSIMADASEAVGSHIAVVERVKEQAAIVRNYSMKTLASVEKGASAAACALGRGDPACLEAYDAALAGQDADREALGRSTHDYLGKQFMVPSPEDEAAEALGAAQDAAAGAAFSRFTGSF